MGSLFGSKQRTTSTTNPYSGKYSSQVDNAYQLISNKANNPTQSYTGQLNATTNDTQNNAVNNYNNLTNTQALNDTISGKYLDPSTNPYLQKTYDIAANNINKSYGEQTDQYDSKFGSNSFWGGSQHQKALQDLQGKETQALSDLNTQIYGNAYNQERTNQMNAINQAGNLYGQQYNVGQSQYNNSQDALDRQYSDYQYGNSLDNQNTNNLLQYLSLVKNPSQSETTTKTPGIGSLLFK